MLGWKFLSVFFAVHLACAGSFAAESGEKDRIEPFLQKHCFSCHTGETPEAGLDLEKLSLDLADAEVRRRWVDLHDRVAAGEMPPETEQKPSEAETSAFLKTLGDSLTKADLAGKRVVLRRLNRSQYENTVRDLFGIHVSLQTILPDDAPEQGFDTIGSSLSVSAEQMVLYLEAADVVLDQVFGPAQPPRRIEKSANFTELRSKTTADRILDDGVVLFSGAKSLPTYGLSTMGPGLYRLTVDVKAVQSEEPVILRIDGGVTGRIPGHVAGFFEVPPGKITTIELRDRAIENSDTFAFALVGGFPWWSVNADQYKGPGVFIGDIKVEGPLEDWPPPSRARVLGKADPAKGTLEDIRGILLRILPLAFRRTTEEAEAEPYVALARQALNEGVSFEKALRRALKGILAAPEFLFLEERQTEEAIDDFALASRLSYFLWSSMPDQELFALAGQNDLHKPDVLRAQVERMLKDRKSRRFVESFTGQWLRLRDIDFTVPDRQLYPEYDQLLRQSMLEETRIFFQEILDRDLSVQNFIDSDFLTINGPLAEFYGIAGVRGLETRRVDRPAGSVRGGVLTQASILKVSADGTRTSPVLRGAWILENLYGTPSPPPPPSVEAIEPDIRGATTIREQLAKHRDNPSCQRCHRKIDPPGFALERFDVIGGERDWYRTAQGGKPVQKPLHPQSPSHTVRYRQGRDVDASGTLPDGRSFAGIRDYKQLLLEQESAMPGALTRHLLTYSLGRHLTFSDRPEIDRIVANAKAKNDGLRSLIHEVTQNPMFREP